MARLVVLDSSPLWLLASPRGKPHVIPCRNWLVHIEQAGARVIIPEVADYEVRRELLLRKAVAGLTRLDSLKRSLEYLAINTPAMLKAAEFWALLRASGTPTADPRSLDADAILAGQAVTVAQPGDTMVIATTNVRHLQQFPGVQAELWTAIQ